MGTIDILPPTTSLARDKLPRHSRRNVITGRPSSTAHPCRDAWSPSTIVATVTSISPITDIPDRRPPPSHHRALVVVFACLRVRVSSTVFRILGGSVNDNASLSFADQASCQLPPRVSSTMSVVFRVITGGTTRAGALWDVSGECIVGQVRTVLGLIRACLVRFHRADCRAR